MKRITVTPSNAADTRRWAADLPDAEAQPWIDKQVQTNSWGLPDRQVPDPNWTPAEGQTEADRPMINLPAEYTVVVTDIPDATYTQQQQDQKRATGVAIFNATDPNAIVLRAIAQSFIDIVNILRARDMARDDAVRLASSLANLQTRYAAITPKWTQDITYDKAKQDVRDNMTQGKAD